MDVPQRDRNTYRVRSRDAAARIVMRRLSNVQKGVHGTSVMTARRSRKVRAKRAKRK